jgi:hypothetical protein
MVFSSRDKIKPSSSSSSSSATDTAAVALFRLLRAYSYKYNISTFGAVYFPTFLLHGLGLISAF